MGAAPPAGAGSTIAGIFWLGDIRVKASVKCSPLEMFTGVTACSRPVSSNKISGFMPFGVVQK